MNRALLIAEKPDLMRKIEEVYKAHREEIPYEINFYSQRGHLITLKAPDEIDETLKEWSWDTLPLHPEEHGGWQYKVIEERSTGGFKTSRERYDEIKKAAYSGKYDFVINAGDPDQEGELLVRIVLKHLGNQLPVMRFWTNDLTSGKILSALQHLRDDEKDPQLVHLLAAAYGRQHSDYRFGMNLSRAATLKMGARVACGRVKTPILAIVCRREKEIRGFVPKTVYGVRAQYAEGFTGTLFDPGETEEEPETEEGQEENSTGTVWYETKKEAEEMIASLPDTAKIMEFKAVRAKTYAPKLFKLASAQVAAGKIGYSAADTLRIIQRLYEKKILSYPRTSCEYLSSNEDLDAMLASASVIPEFTPFVRSITKEDVARVRGSKRWINDKALQEEGHSALSPTTHRPDWDELEKEEQDIYRLICRQFIAPFLPPLIQDKTNVVASAGEGMFRSSGKTLIDHGYTKIFGQNFTDVQIPAHQEGDILAIKECEVPEKTSVCPKRYTTPELISVCENPQKFLDDKELKKLGKRLKIGTPATRSNIIEELIARDHYLEINSEGKRTVVMPSKVGEAIIDNIGDCDICKVDLTGEWEEKLEAVRRGELSLDSLERGMMTHVEKLILDLKKKEMKPLSTAREGYKELGPCPYCGKKLMRGPKMFYCTGYKSGCKAGGPRVRDNAEIKDEEFLQMLSGKEIAKMMQRNGITWRQTIRLDENGRIDFAAGNKVSGYTCPCCGKKVIETPTGYSCEGRQDKSCEFYLGKSISGKIIPKEEIDRLFKEGHTSVITGFVSKKNAGKAFDAELYYDKEEKKVKMRFAERIEATPYKCPVCGKMMFRKGFYYVCEGEKNNTCHFRMHATMYKEEIPDTEIRRTLHLIEDGKISGGEYAMCAEKPAELGLSCPVCGRGVIRTDYAYTCPGTAEHTCTLNISRFVGGHTLSDEVIRVILAGEKTEVLKGLKSSKGNTFDASLYLDPETKRIKYAYAQTEEESAYTCPCCEKKLKGSGFKLTCTCGFSAWIKGLTEKDKEALFTKGKTRVIKFEGREKPFKARMVINKEEKRASYEYVNDDTPSKKKRYRGTPEDFISDLMKKTNRRRKEE